MFAPIHRTRQFLGALRARPADPASLREAMALLTPAQQALLLAQPAREVAHALACCALLPSDDPPVQRAALLHDVGKGKLRLLDRVLFVLMSSTPPGRTLVRKLAAPTGPAWRKGIFSLLHHADSGARAAAAAGADEETVRLVRHHHDHRPNDQRLQRLRKADDRA